MRKEAIERFWGYVSRGPSCWEWTGCKNGNGYGRFWDGENRIYPHRLSYELLRGKIPDGLFIDHLCRNRLCVNPDHLEPVTNRENVMRGRVKAANSRSVCVRGHQINTPESRIKAGSGTRCKRCATEYWRARYLAQKAGVV